MKHVFIINPKAGQGTGIEELKKRIEDAAGTEFDVEIYDTKAVGDAEIFVRNYLSGLDTAEEVRFIACGGDGTFNEVLNGAAGYENAAIGVIPTGTGNDFVRNFPEVGDFSSVEAQLQGETVKCDAIRYSGIIDGELKTRYCGNMFNIGFDCNVVDLTGVMKTKPLISGSLAYLISVMIILIRKKGADLRIEADGELLADGPILLTSIANGSYCGGGVMSNPYASVQDGRIDLSIVNNVSRIKFITLFPSYTKGRHLTKKGIEKIILNRKAQKITITPRKGTMRLCTDGEIAGAEKITFDVVHEAFNLVAPKVMK